MGTAEENNDLLGDMPLASQVGYIFSKKIDEQAIQTMAHELGHGLFHLKHPFSGGNDHLKGTTTNLMDYKNGQTLTKYQWDQIHQPKPVLFPGLQGEDEGEFVAQVIQCLTGAAIDFTIYYSVVWVSMHFDESIANPPGLTDFGDVTNYRDFSWSEAGISAGISCGASVLPFLSSKKNIEKISVATAALGGAATGMATELARQYDIAYEKLEKQGKGKDIEHILPEIEWTPVFVSAGMDAMITAFSTYVATHPKYTKLVNTIKNRLGAGDDFKQKLFIYLKEKTGNQLAEKAGKFTRYSNLVNRLDELEKIVPGSKAKFFEDFESATEDVIKKIGDNPELVDAWKALGEFPNLHKIPSNLEVLSKVKGKFTYNGKVGKEALEEIFTGHRSAQKFIDNLNKAEELFEGVGIKQWTGIKSSGEVRILGLKDGKPVILGKVDDGKFTITASKPNRPDPDSYLTQKYIDDHLSHFDGGVTKITSYNPTGAVGPPGGTFVLPKILADDMIAQAGGNVNSLEDLLGLKRGDLGASPFRIDVDNSSGLRMPSGNEPGANEFWIPGGITSGGIIEATVDQIQPDTFTKNSVF